MSVLNINILIIRIFLVEKRSSKFNIKILKFISWLYNKYFLFYYLRQMFVNYFYSLINNPVRDNFSLSLSVVLFFFLMFPLPLLFMISHFPTMENQQMSTICYSMLVRINILVKINDVFNENSYWLISKSMIKIYLRILY